MFKLFSKGEVVVLPFPFSNLRATKRRPALVVATLQGDDVICCQITSEERFDDYALLLEEVHFKEGGLQQASRIRPNKLFTADKNLITYKIGKIKEQKIKEVEEMLLKIFKN